MEKSCISSEPPAISTIRTSTMQQIQSIYPNPANNSINFQVTNTKDKESIFNIYDGRGQLLLSENRFLTEGTNTIELDISALPIGLYFVTGDESTLYQNFVILR